MRLFGYWAAPLLLLLATAAAGADDAERGARVFRQCMACHSVESGEHMTGPSLAHVWNRSAGTADNFLRYSEAMKRTDVTWNEATLDQWLNDPARFLPGTTMTFAGVKDGKSRQDLVAYLKAVAEGRAPQPMHSGQGMMAKRSTKLDLRKPPPEGRVTGIKHCGDTYTVETADGKSEKIWEFNLRFKTDSGRHGPLPGQPVVIGAGMQGDRASVVFAASGEISAFIRSVCF